MGDGGRAHEGLTAFTPPVHTFHTTSGSQVSETPDLVECVRTALTQLGGTSDGVELDALRQALRDRARRRNVLLVLDDVWQVRTLARRPQQPTPTPPPPHTSHATIFGSRSTPSCSVRSTRRRARSASSRRGSPRCCAQRSSCTWG
jgi:hypothetical protein